MDRGDRGLCHRDRRPGPAGPGRARPRRADGSRAAAPLVHSTPGAPGTAAIGPGATAPPSAPALEPDIQVVRFQGPPGLTVEVLAPAPDPVPAGDGGGILTVGLKRGVGYRLRVSNIPERPGVALFPVIEVVGHLHRPPDIDPAKYPIRVIFSH